MMPQLTVTRQHAGLVLLLEEDHFVSPDFLHVLGMLRYHQQTHHQAVDILSLGTYLKKFSYKANAKQVTRNKAKLQPNHTTDTETNQQ